METSFKRPVSVLVVVWSRDGKVLLMRRKQPEDFWQSVTGSLEWDEEPMQAAVRELFEETGLAATGLEECGVENRFPIIPAWRARYAPEVEFNTEHVFHLALDSPGTIHLNPAEHTEYDWFSLDEALALASSSTNREAIRSLPMGML